MKYRPDIIISVHPLMQHVPIRILRSKGLLNKIVFTTVVTDLSTCHPTWLVILLLCMLTVYSRHSFHYLNILFRFHKLVTRCYCPSTEVAKRALKAGLQPSKLKVYGLPVRPSFVKPIRPKVDYWFKNCLFAFDTTPSYPSCLHLIPHSVLPCELFLIDGAAFLFFFFFYTITSMISKLHTKCLIL